MRKLYHFLVVTVFLLCLVPQTCLAIMYANGDANYPIWNTGNRGGSALIFGTSPFVMHGWDRSQR